MEERRCCDVVARTHVPVHVCGGLSLANAKLGAVHGFSGTLGGLLHAPHGAICAALLPHCCTVNVAALKGWFGEKDPELAAELGVDTKPSLAQ